MCLLVWIYSLISVGLISLVGLISVLTVPLLNMCCFNYTYQFLTALAMGSYKKFLFIAILYSLFNL